MRGKLVADRQRARRALWMDRGASFGLDRGGLAKLDAQNGMSR